MKRALALVAGLAAALPAAGYVKWRKDSADVTRIIQAHTDPLLDTYTRDRVSILPDPVVRYFRHALPEGQRYIRLARIEQEGEFFLNDGWHSFHATQIFSGRPAGFMWDARISMGPLMPVFVRDSYAAGVAGMRASMLALYPLVHQSGAPELNAGALSRYLAEAVWFPTALLPHRGLTWAPVDAHSATATLTDGTTSVSLRFTFNADGDIVEAYAPDRFRELNGTYVPTPWRVRALAHDQQHGIRIMSSAEVEWLLPEGPLTYWRGRITGVEYE
jgi:hypothetical protein